MILAVNCGDDTDCTAATLGSLMGLMYGMRIIPADWRAHIGDDIVTLSVNLGFGAFPKTCTELTDLVMQQIPMCARQKQEYLDPWQEPIELTDGPDDFSAVSPETYYGDAFVKDKFSRSPYSVTMENAFAEALVEFETEPVIAAGGTLKCKITVKQNHNFARQDHYELNWYLPEGWRAEGKSHVFASPYFSKFTQHSFAEITLCAAETVAAQNRLVLEVRNPDHAMPILVPLTVLG